MKRIAAVLAGLSMMLAVGLAATGCGDGISAGDRPELRVESTELTVNIGPSNRTRVLESDLVLENTGPGDLKIESIEWIARPDRVRATHQGSLYEEERACESGDDCGADGVCMTQSGRCTDIGFRDISEPFVQRAKFNQRIRVIASDDVVDCPEPDNPDEVPEGYCGEIRVETNAPNDTETGTEGTAHIYLVSEDASGLMEIPQEYSFIEFTHAEPGTTQTEEFEVRNAADGPLEIHAAYFDTNPGWFEITPSMFGVEIAGNQSKSFTLAMTPPENASTEQLNFQSELSFDSTSTNFELPVQVHVTDGPGDVAIMEVDPGQLSFANGEPQTLTVENHGSSSLRLFGMDVRPDPVAEHYSVTYDGQDALGDSGVFPLTVPQADEEGPSAADFEVELLNPDAESTVGEIRINHKPAPETNLTTIPLLGDATEVAIGEIGPTTVRFRSDGGGADQQRLMSVTNVGNDPLDITQVHFEERNQNTDAANYTVDGLETTVEPGGVASATVTYSGTTQTPQDLRVYVDSNHAGQPEEMEFQVLGTDLTEPTMEVGIDPSFTTDAAVGETATFTVTDSSDQAQLNLASWYVHSRPAASEALIEGTGEEATMNVDAAGTYQISVVVRDGDNREVQETFEFDAVDG